jgi:general L-amino acid transport system permease protein
VDPNLPFTPLEPGTEEPMTLPDTSVPHKRLPPGEWLRKRLFNNWYNSVLTIVLGVAVLWGAFLLLRFVFVTARWEPLTENLTLFMMGRFPRDEQWRIVVQVIIWSATIGLAWGAAVAGAKFRAMQAGVAYVEDSTLAKVRRYWGLLVLVGLMLLGTRTIGPLILAIVSVAVGVVFGMLASRVPGSFAGLLWAGVAILGVAGYQIVSGFEGNAWIWMGAAVAAGVVNLLGRRDWHDTRQQRIGQLIGVVGTFVGVFLVYLALGAAFELEGVGWDKWEGFHLNLISAAVAITLSFPLGLLLALGRRSSFPALRVMSTAYIELIRGVPMISLLLMAQFFIGFFLDTDTPLSLITRALAAMTLFTAAYVAEIVRGGLQAVPKGQTEAGQSIGLSPFAVTRLIVLPQALRAVIPAMVGQFISLFKDTSLLTIIGVSEILNVRELVHGQQAFRGFGIAETLVFVMLAFWAISFTMSRESQRLERKLGVGER